MKPNPPKISDYIDALQTPEGRFRTLSGVEAFTDTHGEVVFYAGNSAAVFPVLADGRKITLKCYIKRPLHGDAIYSYIETRSGDPLLTPCRLMKEEFFVHDIFGCESRCDVLAADWVEGATLEAQTRLAVRENDREGLARLSAGFEKLAGQLLGREWAHGDLKPENIVVGADGAMRLVDYDAMWIPALTGCTTVEVGTPQFQHPARDESYFCKAIDDYPIALIAVVLRTLALDASFYKRLNNYEDIQPEQIIAGCSSLWHDIVRLFDSHGHYHSYNLAMALRSPVPDIPGLGGMLNAEARQPAGIASYIPKEYAADAPMLFESGGLWGYRDASGRVAIPAVYERATEFSCGMAAVCILGVWKIIDTCGSVRAVCEGYSEVRPFSDGVAAALRGGVWGYIREDGTALVGPRFEVAGSMRAGRAAVKAGGRYGFLDHNGQMVIDAVFDYATGFHNGAATVCLGDRTWSIDHVGNPI